jgi:membrane protease YdiL (CAAX protease family)
VAGGELLTSLISPVVGVLFHTLLMMTLLVHGALGRNRGESRLTLGLSLAPMIRLLSLTLPLIKFPQEAWYPMVSVPLLAATWIIARQLGLPRQALGLRVRTSVGWAGPQLMFAGFGLGLGAIEYVILRPRPLIPSFDWLSVAVAALSLLIFTGFNEEIIFRGLIQTVALPVLRNQAVLYVAVLFGVLHIGYLSVLDLVFVTAVGFVFGQVVRWGGSILGVTLAHGLTNITLFLVMPHVMARAPAALDVIIPVMAVLMLASAYGALVMWKRAGGQGPTHKQTVAGASHVSPAIS